eukprot:4041507-Lingulodinium_polyedra.AAC.1
MHPRLKIILVSRNNWNSTHHIPIATHFITWQTSANLDVVDAVLQHRWIAVGGHLEIPRRARLPLRPVA